MDKIIRRKNRTVKKLTSGVKMRLTSSEITIVEGTAVLNGETDGMIRIQCGNALFTVKNVFLCTGSETVIPPIKGLSDTDYWTSREALDSKELPKELAIIGGGVIGIEFASFFTSMGVKVKVIEMMPEILGAMDKEASAMLRSEYAKKGVEFHLNTKVTEVNPKEVIVEKDGKTNAISADKILVSVGRRAITKNLGLESLSIETDRRGVRVNDICRPPIRTCMQPEISQGSRNWPTRPIGKVRLLSTIFWGMRNGWITGLFPPSSTPIRKWPVWARRKRN